MGSAIYAKKAEEITKEERFGGKTTILGSGYGMGPTKFKIQLKTFNTEVSEGEARHNIDVYRIDCFLNSIVLAAHHAHTRAISSWVGAFTQANIVVKRGKVGPCYFHQSHFLGILCKSLIVSHPQA